MVTTAPFVQFSRVNKSYDGKNRIVTDLDLTIAEGEFLTLLGPSGSGKTTCLMMLAGFEDANSGEIFISGQKINSTPAYKRNIGMVFQNYALFPHMTIAENIAFPLKQRKIGKQETAERVAKALDMVRLTQFSDRQPRQLSGGQQQRVALARALVFEPRLVLMDEPLGALDRRLREHMQIEIKQLHDRIGTTIVYVTHDQNEALTMSNRIAVFSRGGIEHIAAPDEIYERPATSFVAHFIGENNSLFGTVEAAGAPLGHIRLTSGELVRMPLPANAVQGSEVEVTVRPERLEIGAGAEGENSVTVTITDVIYNGETILLPGVIGDGSPVQLKIAAASTGATVNKGDKINVKWRPDAGRVFLRKLA